MSCLMSQASLPPQFTLCLLVHSLPSHSLTGSLTHSPAHWCTHSFIHSLTSALGEMVIAEAGMVAGTLIFCPLSAPLSCISPGLNLELLMKLPGKLGLYGLSTSRWSEKEFPLWSQACDIRWLQFGSIKTEP